MSDNARNRLSCKWLLGISIIAVVSIVAYCWYFHSVELQVTIPLPNDVEKQEVPILVSPEYSGPEVSLSGPTLNSQKVAQEEHQKSIKTVSTPVRTTVQRGVAIPFTSWQNEGGTRVHLPGGLETNVPQIELSFYLKNIGGGKDPFEVGILGVREQGGRLLNNFAVDGTGLRLAVGRSDEGGDMLRVGATYRVVNVPVSCSFVVPDIPSGTVHRVSLVVKDLEHDRAEQIEKAAIDAYLRNITIEILDYRRKEPDLEPFFVTYANDQVFRSEPVASRLNRYSVEGIRLGGELAINLRSSEHVWCYIRSVNSTNVVFPGADQLVVDPQALRSVSFEFENPKQLDSLGALALYFDVNARVPLFWKRVEGQRTANTTAVNIQALPGVYDLRGVLEGVRGPSLPLGKIRISDSGKRIVIRATGADQE